MLAGPFATMVLGDLGADVLKVERPVTGDDTRRWGPPFAVTDDAAYFTAVNRNRRSVTLDLADAAGAQIVATLARSADVVVENFLPRHLRSLGLETLRAQRGRTVWVSVRGAGGDGPDADLPGYDAMVQARSGLMSVTGHPGTGPVKVGVAIADVVTGLYAAVAALAGLVARASSTPRQASAQPEAPGPPGAPGPPEAPAPPAPAIEVPLLEAAISALVNQAANHLVGGQVPQPMGNEHPNLAPYGPVPCADGPLVVGAGNDEQFARLCHVIGRGDLASDARFAGNGARVANRTALRDVLSGAFRTDTAASWRVRLAAAGVPCAPVSTMDEVFADPHVRAVGLVGDAGHPAGPLPLVRSPLRVDGRRPGIRRPPPALGEHTGEVLAALGLDEPTVAALRERGAC